MEVPLSDLIEVSAIIIEHEIPQEMIAGDNSSEMIALTLACENDEREVIHSIDGMLEDQKEDNGSKFDSMY